MRPSVERSGRMSSYARLVGAAGQPMAFEAIRMLSSALSRQKRAPWKML